MSKTRGVAIEVDKGWSWVVMSAGFVNFMLYLAFRNTAGIFYVYIMDEFGLKLSALTFIGSSSVAVACSSAVITVRLTEQFGIRPVIIAGGLITSSGYFMCSFMSSYPLLFTGLALLAGFGHSLCFTSFIVAIDNYFEKRKFLAMTISTSGASFSFVIFSPVSELVLQTYGFNGAMLIFSAVYLNFIVCGAVVFPLKLKDSTNPASSSDKKKFAFSRTISFVVYLVSNFLMSVGFYIPTGILPDTAVSRGFNLNRLSLTFILSGVMQTIGRLTFCAISMRYLNQTTRLWCIFLILLGINMLIIPFATSVFHYSVFNLLYGFLTGGILLGCFLCPNNLVEPKYFGRAVAFTQLTQGIGSKIGNPLAAFLQDITEDDGMPYYFGTSVITLGGFLLLPFSKAIYYASDDVDIKISESIQEMRNEKDMEKNHVIQCITENVTNNGIKDIKLNKNINTTTITEGSCTASTCL